MYNMFYCHKIFYIHLLTIIDKVCTTHENLFILFKSYVTSGRYFPKYIISSSWFTWFCKPLYNSSQWAMPNPHSLKVNSADSTVSSTGSMWQEVYTTACLVKRIIFSSRATELMLFHSHPGSAYWSVKLPCCILDEHSVNPTYLFIPAVPTRLWFNHWLLCRRQTIPG